MTAWMQTASGRPIDLDAPDLADLDIGVDLAGPLAVLARFIGHHADPNGRTPAYSVAQHCCVGADALLAETGRPDIALAFLMHDAHEALIGDIATPTRDTLETALGSLLVHVFGSDAQARVRAAIGCDPMRATIAGVKARIDRHLHRLAGLPSPLPEEMRTIVAEMDLRMLDLERRQILAPTRRRPAREIWPAAVCQARPVRLRGRLTPWPARRAAAEWLRRFEAWRIRPSD